MSQAGLLAVQISSAGAHHNPPGRSGLWGITVLTIGVVCICCGTVPMLRIRQWRATAFMAQGRVADNVPRPSWRGKTTWLPLIEFEANGVTITSAIRAAATRQGWPLGHAVDVLYDPDHPHRAGLADARLRISPWLILGVAVVAVFLAVVT